MKKLLPLIMLSLTFSSAWAQTRGVNINTKTLDIIEVTKIDTDTQTARYYSYRSNQWKEVSLADLSKAVYARLDGVKERDMVLASVRSDDLQPCEVWNVFENSLVELGCQNGRISDNIGVDRPELSSYIKTTQQVVKEVTQRDGFQKKDKVRLMKDQGDLKKGDLVRIEHIFENGEAMIQKMGLNLIDTSGLLMKDKVEVVDLKDLAAK